MQAVGAKKLGRLKKAKLVDTSQPLILELFLMHVVALSNAIKWPPPRGSLLV